MTSDFTDLTQMGKCEQVLAFDDGSTLVCDEVVRVVPGKRIVLRGNWQGQAVYAKIFFGRDARRYAHRDQHGVEALLAAHIATPALLHVGTIADQAVVLTFAAVTDSANAEQAWTAMHVEQRRELARKLVAEVARHHAAGLMQSDLYLKNFLLQDTRILTLDGDGIRPLPHFLRERAALANLARLLSKFDIEHEAAWLPALLVHYAEMRDLPAAPELSAMQKRVDTLRRSAINRYAERKVFRQCTDVEVQQDWQRYTAVVRGDVEEITRNALLAPEALMAAPERLLKRGNTCTVAQATAGPRKVVVKRYNIKSFWHGLGRAWRPSRAAASWSNAHRLRMSGIATAAPLALVERRWGVLRREAWFTTEYVEAPDAVAFFAGDAGLAQKDEAAEHIALLFHKLYLLQLAHGDLKASNILMAGGQPVLIDLDAMRQYRCRRLFRRRHVRDLRRFMQNWRRDESTYVCFAAAFERVYQNPTLLSEAGIVKRIK
jgi:tRNA A-37 threonylcarbamoyl transferase component Bud32